MKKVDQKCTQVQFPVPYFRVKYAKHSKMNRNKTVRIFSNADLSKLSLPKAEYKSCKKCAKFVHNSQFHCDDCDGCEDRSGRGVKHCVACKKCTVAKQVHCNMCKACKPKDHVCKRACDHTTKCFKCGQGGHKAVDCDSKIVKKE